MCEPTTIAILAAGAAGASGAVLPALAIAGVGLGAYATLQAGRDAQAAHNRNAAYNEQQAQDASRRGAIEEENHRLKVRAMLGAQRAVFGANNVVASSGTPLLLAAETAQFGEADALTIRNNAAREVFGYRHQALEERLTGKAKKREAKLGALSTALTGGAQAYGMWRDR
jgi:hypothetical protein